MTGPRIDPRRPALVVAVGAVLAVVALLLPPFDVSGAGPSSVAPSVPSGTVVPAPAAPCVGVRDSLRPAGGLPAAGTMPAGSTMARIAARGRLVAGVDQGKYLLGYRDPQTGRLQGSDIDIARSIAAAIFGDPERVQYVVVDIADRATLLERSGPEVDRGLADPVLGHVDVVVNSFTVTCDRQRSVEFSTPYITASQRVLVPAGSGVTEIEQLRGRRVCTSTGATNVAVLRDLGAGLDVVTMPGIPDCVVAMQQGRVDAVSSDDGILAGVAAQDPQSVVVGRALASTQYAVGTSLAPAEADLTRFVNAVLDRDRASGALTASEQRWLGGVLVPLPAVPPARYRD